MQRLPQQLPALLDLVGGHEVQAGVIAVFVVRLVKRASSSGEHRVIRPRLARWPRLRELGEPKLEALVQAGQQSATGEYRGSGARQPGDEDRSFDRHVGVLRVLLPCRLRHQPRDERVANEEPAHLAAELGQIGVAPIGA